MCPSRTFVLGQLGQTGISFGDLEPIPPVPIQMTVVNKPSLKLFKFSAQLPALLGPLSGGQPFLFCESPVRGPSRCKPRKTRICLRSSRCAAVQPTAPYGLFRGPLAGRPVSGLGTTPMAGPIRTETPRDTLFKVAVCHAEISV